MTDLLPLALTIAILVFAVSSMLMVGLRYTVADLLRPLRDIPGVSIALVTNFVLVPLLAWALLRVFPLEADYATGLVIVASAAGAPLLVKLAMNAKEDVGFAASLIVLLLVGTIVAMPLIIRWMTAEGRIGAWAIARPLLQRRTAPRSSAGTSHPTLAAARCGLRDGTRRQMASRFAAVVQPGKERVWRVLRVSFGRGGLFHAQEFHRCSRPVGGRR